MRLHARATAKLRKQDAVSIGPEHRSCNLTKDPIDAVGLLRCCAPVLRLQASVSAGRSPIRELTQWYAVSKLTARTAPCSELLRIGKGLPHIVWYRRIEWFGR
jgi:hypothetical protein